MNQFVFPKFELNHIKIEKLALLKQIASLNN